MSKGQSFFDKLAGKKNVQPASPLPEALPYPVQVCRRVFEDERIRKPGGLQVCDSPEALALNEARMRHLESTGLDLAGKRVLDVGAGVGHLAARLLKMGCSVFCVEGRPGNVASMRARYPQLQGAVGSVETEPLSRFGEFDVVFSYGLLYHLENPLHSIWNMASVSKQ
jgi:2-polyprenyl-3-methyl-5-hydroxy-6-metoxy-1,4-benzoquinol methylase